MENLFKLLLPKTEELPSQMQPWARKLNRTLEQFTNELSAKFRRIMAENTSGNVGIGTDSPSANADLTLENGVLCIKETTTPVADTNYGKIYTKSDNKLYFQDGGGSENALSTSSSGVWDGTRVIEDHASSDTLTNAEAGSVHTNKGAGGTITLTLPDPGTEGAVFTFCVSEENYTLRIEPQSATILNNVSPFASAGKYNWANYQGETLSLICDAAGNWLVIAKNGTWSEEV